jgi:hypothetical protein
MSSQWTFKILLRETKIHFPITTRLSRTFKPEDEGNQLFLDWPKRKQMQEDASESGARMAMRMDNIDNEAGDAVDKDGFRVEPEPVK